MGVLFFMGKVHSLESKLKQKLQLEKEENFLKLVAIVGRERTLEIINELEEEMRNNKVVDLDFFR